VAAADSHSGHAVSVHTTLRPGPTRPRGDDCRSPESAHRSSGNGRWRCAGRSLLLVGCIDVFTVMRSMTAVRLSTPPRQGASSQRKSWSDGWHRLAERGSPWASSVTGRIRARWMSDEEQLASALVRGHFVGLGGVEPPTSSLSAITRSPLCNPAFLQVVGDRKRQSNALFERLSEGVVEVGFRVRSRELPPLPSPQSPR
jgi:hypothetical protein